MRRSVLRFGLLAWLILCALECKRGPSPCERVLGRWEGVAVEGTEGASTELRAIMRDAARAERWTVTASALEREGVGVEQLRVIEQDRARCVVELRRADRGGGSRVLELELGEDGELRARSRGGAEQTPTVVLVRRP